jgi:hypothetical protein
LVTTYFTYINFYLYLQSVSPSNNSNLNRIGKFLWLDTIFISQCEVPGRLKRRWNDNIKMDPKMHAWMYTGIIILTVKCNSLIWRWEERILMQGKLRDNNSK